MRRLSVLVMLIVCVTVGSVYAAWTYKGTTVSAVDRTLSHGLTTATTDGDVGVLTVYNNNVDIAIDQTAEGNYEAKLKITGQVDFHFTPFKNQGVSEDILNNGIDAEAKIYLKNADTNLYDGKPIYIASSEGVDIVWEKEEDGTFHGTVTAEQIASMLSISEGIVLDTHAKYQQFHALEENITITLQISQK